MKRCEVMIPFHMIATDTDHVPGDVIEVSEEQLAKIQAVNVNMVLVLGEVEEPVQDDPVQEDATEQEEPVEQEEPEKPKKRTKKQ